MAIEIVSFPITVNMVIFHGHVNVYQETSWDVMGNTEAYPLKKKQQRSELENHHVSLANIHKWKKTP